MTYKDVRTGRYISIERAIAEKIRVVKVRKGKKREYTLSRSKVYKRKPPTEPFVKLRTESGRFISPDKINRNESYQVVEIVNGVANEEQYRFFTSRKHAKKVMNYRTDLVKEKYGTKKKKGMVRIAQLAYKVSGKYAKAFYIWELIHTVLGDKKATTKVYKENKERWMETNLNTVKKEIRKLA